MNFKADARRFFMLETWSGERCFTPQVVRIAIWSAVVGWTAWIASDWAREAIATPPTAPVLQSRNAADLDAAMAQALAAPIFGKLEQSAGEENPTPVASNVKLRGVVASGAGPVGAIVNTGRDDAFVPLDRELSPGVVLQAVHPTHIVVRRNGSPERVELDALKLESPGSKGSAESKGGRTPHARGAPAQPDAADAAVAGSPAVSEGETAPATPDGPPAAPLAPPMKNSGVTLESWGRLRVAKAATPQLPWQAHAADRAIRIGGSPEVS